MTKKLQQAEQLTREPYERDYVVVVDMFWPPPRNWPQGNRDGPRAFRVGVVLLASPLADGAAAGFVRYDAGGCRAERVRLVLCFGLLVALSPLACIASQCVERRTYEVRWLTRTKAAVIVLNG